MNLKKFLENLITTSAFDPSNLVGSRTPEGGHKDPERLPFKRKKKKKKPKKKAEVTKNQDMIMDIQKQATPYKIKPAQW